MTEFPVFLHLSCPEALRKEVAIRSKLFASNITAPVSTTFGNPFAASSSLLTIPNWNSTLASFRSQGCLLGLRWDGPEYTGKGENVERFRVL